MLSEKAHQAVESFRANILKFARTLRQCKYVLYGLLLTFI